MSFAGLAGSVASFLGLIDEDLTHIKDATGTFDVDGQVYTPGATTETDITGLVELVESGLDGASTVRDIFNIWISTNVLDAANVTIAVGDRIEQASTGKVFVVLEYEPNDVFGFYRLRTEIAQ